MFMIIVMTCLNRW